MKILRLARARVRLWASQGSDSPFEVTKAVSQPLQALCQTAPHCPEPRSPFEAPALWIDPLEAPRGECPYAFRERGECLSHRNQLALEAALFLPHELDLTRRLLEAVGFEVTEEAIDPVHDATILLAHGHMTPGNEVRLMHSPVAGPIVLVRDRTRPRRAAPLLRLEGAHPL